MNDGLPSEEQLQRMERAVMARIRRRAELPKRIATGAAVAALFAGGVFVLPRLVVSGAVSSAGSGGSTARYGESDRSSGASGAGSSALLAVCHASPSPADPGRRVPVSADTPAAAIDACVVALQKGRTATSSPTSGKTFEQRPLRAQDLVACRDADGLLQVFGKDAHPTTLCRRNGLSPAG